MQEYARFLYFYIIFADIPCVFLQGEINCWGGGSDRKKSAPVSALYMSCTSQGWKALFDLVETVLPKVYR